MRIIILSSVVMLAACTIQQENGEFRAKAAPLFGGDQSWHISEQKIFSPREKLCVLSAADIDVSLRRDHNRTQPVVNSSGKMDPGARFKILVAGHYYDTVTGVFSAADSRSIVDDFMRSDVTYTEMESPTANAHSNPNMMRATNKISLAGFEEQYQACQSYLGSAKKNAQKR